MVKYILGATDYLVIGTSLLIASAIGIWFRFTGNRQNSTNDYLMAGRDMSKIPVVMSTTVTCLSAMSMIATPAEIYRYGASKVLQLFGTFAGTVLAAYVFIPVYFECRVTTVYEFLEIRYGPKIRYAISALFIVQMVFYMALCLYGSVLAFSAVTDLSTELSIILIGFVCTFYCIMGGLKAVLWTDVFQALLMIVFVIILYSRGITEAGGIGEIFKKSLEGQRLAIWNFSPDLTMRYTFWSVMARGFMLGISYYGTSQIEVQRTLSLRNSERGKSSLLWSSITSFSLSCMCFSLGLMLYGIFYSCDPIMNWKNTGLKKYDQIIPYYIVTRFSSVPGLTGLCISGIFSGSLSSISSALNSVSTVTVIDFLHPIFPKLQIADKRTVVIAKVFSLIYGILCIGLAFSLTKTDSLLATGSTLVGILEGPVVAIFLIAVLTRKCDEKCALVGLVVGLAASCWIGYGSLFSGYRHPPLSLSTSGCPSQGSSLEILLNSTNLCPRNSSCLSTVATSLETNDEIFILYRISYGWIPGIGCFFSILFSFLAILFTGSKDAVPVDSKCLSPITRLWNKSETSATNGCEHMNGIPMDEKLSKI